MKKRLDFTLLRPYKCRLFVDLNSDFISIISNPKTIVTPVTNYTQGRPARTRTPSVGVSQPGYFYRASRKAFQEKI